MKEQTINDLFIDKATAGTSEDLQNITDSARDYLLMRLREIYPHPFQYVASHEEYVDTLEPLRDTHTSYVIRRSMSIVEPPVDKDSELDRSGPVFLDILDGVAGELIEEVKCTAPKDKHNLVMIGKQPKLDLEFTHAPYDPRVSINATFIVGFSPREELTFAEKEVEREEAEKTSRQNPLMTSHGNSKYHWSQTATPEGNDFLTYRDNYEGVIHIFEDDSSFVFELINRHGVKTYLHWVPRHIMRAIATKLLGEKRCLKPETK